MAKAVKKGFRSIEKGVNKIIDKNPVLRKARKEVFSKNVKRLKKNKYVKMVAMAAAIYFTAGAATGAIAGWAGGAGGLSGAWSGAMSGIGSAWTSLGAAGSSVMGGNFAQAGAHLGAGMSGTTVGAQQAAAATAAAGTGAAGGATVGGTSTGSMMGGSNGFVIGGTEGAGASSLSGATALNTGQTVAGVGGTSAGGFGTTAGIGGAAGAGSGSIAAGGGAGASVAPEATKGLLGDLSTGEALVYGQAINTGGTMLANYAQEKGTQEQMEEAAKKYNANVGSLVFMPRYNSATGMWGLQKTGQSFNTGGGAGLLGTNQTAYA